MGFLVNLVLLLVLAAAVGPVRLASGLSISHTFKQDWDMIAKYNAVVRDVCHECDNLCPRAPIPSSEEEKAEIAEQWACYVGCRTTCLLQVGPIRHKYSDSLRICADSCRDQYILKDGRENMFSTLCIEACNSRVTSTKLPKIYDFTSPDFYVPLDDGEEQEPGMLDPALAEPVPSTGGLPHSNYKTLPPHEVLQASAKSPLEYIKKFADDLLTDPLLASVIGMPTLALFLWIFRHYCKKSRIIVESSNTHKTADDQHSLTVEVIQRVQLETDVKVGPPASDLEDDDFVPPPSPPPKYSEVV